MPVSNCALAVATVTRERNKVAVFNTSTSELTGKACSPNHVQWAYDTYALAGSTARALLKEGGDTWFLIQADYTFGATLAAEARRRDRGRRRQGAGHRQAPVSRARPTSPAICCRRRLAAPR